MIEKRLRITPEMLVMMNEIRETCEEIRDCIDCPFHFADNPYNTCRLSIGSYPMSWDLFNMEVESDG